jgi:hypothetical protein
MNAALRASRTPHRALRGPKTATPTTLSRALDHRRGPHQAAGATGGGSWPERRCSPPGGLEYQARTPARSSLLMEGARAVVGHLLADCDVQPWLLEVSRSSPSGPGEGFRRATRRPTGRGAYLTRWSRAGPEQGDSQGPWSWPANDGRPTPEKAAPKPCRAYGGRSSAGWARPRSV